MVSIRNLIKLNTVLIINYCKSDKKKSNDTDNYTDCDTDYNTDDDTDCNTDDDTKYNGSESKEIVEILLN